MKSRIKKTISLLIYSIVISLTIILRGEKQKISIVKYFFEFILKDKEKDSNKYKSFNKGFYNLKQQILSNREVLIEELRRNKYRSAKEKSQNRVTLIVDDTCDGEKHSKKSKKLHRIRDNSLKKIVKTHNIVFLVLTIGMGKHCRKYVLDFRLWQKGGLKKRDLFLLMLNELKEVLLSRGCKLDDFVIVFDSGYSHPEVLDKLDSMGFKFVGKYHHKRKHIVEGEELVITDWLKQRFRKKDFKEVPECYKKNIKNRYYRYVDVEDSKYKHILCLFERKGHKRRPRRFLVTNMESPYFVILERYKQRYYIEGVFRDLKQLFGFNDFHRNDLENKYEDYVCVCIMRYEFVQDFKRENRLTKKTNGEVVKLIRKVFNEMDKNERKEWFSDLIAEESKFSKFY